jgi:aspartate carbamoyltransferase catalytic subunit
MTQFPHRSIISIEQLTVDEIRLVFERAKQYLDNWEDFTVHTSTLIGKTVALAFFENSTRTKFSFEIAARRLGATVLTFTASSSSQQKGESILDTIHTLEAMGVDMMVLRHQSSGIVDFLSQHSSIRFLNAGDGQRNHPTQALLDAYTIENTANKSLNNLRVCIVGDILHSRVARSNIQLLTKLGAKVSICGPKTILPKHTPYNVPVVKTIDEAVQENDVLIVLRLQKERMESGLLPSLEEFSTYYGISSSVIAKNPNITLLHPAPVNYGVEIAFDVAQDYPNSFIKQQVTNGVAIRMALLSLIKNN